jgi:hypothetical protein
MKNMRRRILANLMFFLTVLVLASSLQAMPAFARKYSLSCKTCHSPFPKLKPYGEEFAANGFVIKDKPTPRYTIDTGDSLLSLLRDVPIAFRLEGFLTYNNSNSRKLDFGSPHILKIISGGELFKHVSYYFYFFFSERGEVAGIEDAFVMFNDLLGGDFDIYAGQFQVSDPLFKREIRLSYEDYSIYATKPGDSQIDLTYDRGLMFTYGLKSGTDLAVEVVNGNGIGAGDSFLNFDNDEYKNVLVRLSQDLGPGVRIGGFGYLGKERPADLVNSVWMLGGDATLAAAPFELNLQYVERRDSNPTFAVILPLEKIMTRGAFAELIYRPKGDDGRWYGVGLVNWVDSDQPDLRTTAATLHCGYLLRRNLRLTAETTYIFRGPFDKHLRAGIGLITAF